MQILVQTSVTPYSLKRNSILTHLERFVLKPDIWHEIIQVKCLLKYKFRERGCLQKLII